MRKDTMKAIVCTQSGPPNVLQQGLGALLESLPGITSVKAIRELTNAYAWVEAHQPRIIFIDLDVNRKEPRNSPGENPNIFSQNKKSPSGERCGESEPDAEIRRGNCD